MVHRAPKLTTEDSVVLADFTNTTGDPIFDDTLKQAISVQLAQSPFLNIVSNARIRTTLKLMAKPSGTKLTPDVASDLCQRAGGKAYISGSIAALGSQYVIGLDAINCKTGDPLAQEQVTAENKENVLKALDEAATKLREKLGESLSTVEKFDTPLDQATTPSLEALQALSVGIKTLQEKGSAAAIPSFNHAIELDPNFAAAYAALGISYSNLREPGLANENLQRAYNLRDKVSEPEKKKNFAYLRLPTISSSPANSRIKPSRPMNCSGPRATLAIASLSEIWEWTTHIWDNMKKGSPQALRTSA